MFAVRAPTDECSDRKMCARQIVNTFYIRTIIRNLSIDIPHRVDVARLRITPTPTSSTLGGCAAEQRTKQQAPFFVCAYVM